MKARDVAVQTARAKIEGLRGAINDMRMNQAMAEIHEMAAGMISNIGGAGDTLDRLHEMVEEERTQGGRPGAHGEGLDRHDRASRSRRRSSTRSPTRRSPTSRRSEGISLDGRGGAAPAARTMGAAKSSSERQSS